MPSTTVLAEENPMTEPEYPREDATQGPFSFGAGGFYVHDLCRETRTRLRRLLFPELLKSEKARKSAQLEAWIIDEDWTKAQLQHYGIHFDPDLDPFKAKALLLTSVAHGLCDAVPPQVLKIKTTLKDEYERRMENYHDRMKVYRAQELSKRIKRFETCTTPSEEAKCDASLFLRKHFLDEDGNPDRTKAPDLILLAGYIDKGLALTGRTERVPGLHVANGGLGGASNVMIIGWDRARVDDKAYQIDMEQSSGRGVSRWSLDWDRQMTSHYEWAEKLRVQAEDRDHPASSFSKALHITGKYVVKCDAIQQDLPVLSKEMRLRIIRDTLAIFDLGLVVGLMVLARTPEKVTKLLETGKWNADLEDTDDESDFEDASDGEEDSYEQTAGSSDDSDYDPGNEPDALTDLTSNQPTKRQKNNDRHPRRLYFQWRGYNTMTGAIQFDPQNLNTGHLDFANDEATMLEGNIVMDATGGTASFQGYRVPGLAGPATMNWHAFSHVASERAKVPIHIW